MKRWIWMVMVIGLTGCPAARAVRAGEACTEKLSRLVFQSGSCKELQLLVDAENRNNPACAEFFADGGGFEVCALLRRKDGGADVKITE